MNEANTERRRLARVQKRLEDWRQRHGGPGRPVPEGFWGEAVELARALGSAVTARALRLDQERLERRAGLEPASRASTEAASGFVEVDTSRLGGSGQAVLRFAKQGGERLEIELAAGSPLDVMALARAFWNRG